MSKMLNSLVAVKVMGYEWVKNDNSTFDGSFFAFPEYVWKTDNGHRSSFNPTFDIEDAWKVVEKLKQEEQYYFILENGDLKDYECLFSDRDNNHFRAEDDNPAMAISLAALKAKGVDWSKEV